MHLFVSIVLFWRACVDETLRCVCVRFGAIIKIMISVRLEFSMFVLDHAFPSIPLSIGQFFVVAADDDAAAACASAAHVIDTFWRWIRFFLLFVHFSLFHLFTSPKEEEENWLQWHWCDLKFGESKMSWKMVKHYSSDVRAHSAMEN